MNWPPSIVDDVPVPSGTIIENANICVAYGVGHTCACLSVQRALRWPTSMKILKKDIDVHGVGFFTLKPEAVEDMWHAYNIIAVGDVVTCATFRKVGCAFDRGSPAAAVADSRADTLRVADPKGHQHGLQHQLARQDDADHRGDQGGL